LGKSDLGNLIGITDQVVGAALLLKKTVISYGWHLKRPELINITNAFVAELADWRCELRRIIKGDTAAPGNETLALLLKEIDYAQDPDTKKLYADQVLKILEKLMADGRLEVKNARG